MRDVVREFLAERSELACAPLLAVLVEQIGGLDPAIEPEVTAFGIRFHYRGTLLSEISVFGALFIVRIGSEQAVEFRVRSRAAALDALSRTLEEYGALLLQASASGPPGDIPGTPVPWTGV